METLRLVLYITAYPWLKGRLTLWFGNVLNAFGAGAAPSPLRAASILLDNDFLLPLAFILVEGMTRSGIPLPFVQDLTKRSLSALLGI